MSWHYLRELEGESLEDICSGGELLQPLKSKITHAEFYCNGKLMDSYLDSLSGTTSAHSMAKLGQEKSMSSQVDFHAKIFQPQERVMDLKVNDLECGQKWRASFTRFNHDLCSWKTHQCSLLGDLDEFSETWPQWGLMRNGECWDMTGSVVNTGETEFGLLATPTKELFSHWASARAKISTNGRRKSGVKVGSIFWWDMTEQHLRLGGLEERKMIPDPSCGEVVMGWPMGWTELQPLAMDKFQEWLQQHGES
jgi:hypothetical protein